MKIKLTPHQLVELYEFFRVAIEWRTPNPKEKLVIALLTRIYLKINGKIISHKITLNLSVEESLAYYIFYQEMFHISVLSSGMNELMRTTLDGMRDKIHQAYLV